MPKVTLTGMQCKIELTLDLDSSNIESLQAVEQKAQLKEVETILRACANEEIAKATREVAHTLNQMKGV